MPILNQEEIFGKLIPTVYIDRITLETTGQNPVKIDNPHVNDETIDVGGEKKFKTVTSTDPSFLKVSLDLTIKESLGADSIGRWFNDEKIRKYIKIRVIQSTDPVLSRALSSSNNAMAITQQTAFENLKSPALQTLIKGWGFLDKGGNISDMSSFLEKLNSSSDEVNLTLNHDVLGDTASLSSKYSQIDDNGNSIINVNFKAVFTIEAENPKHLAYFVVSYLDMDLLREDFNLSLNSFTSKLQNGEVKSEVVIDDSKLVGKSIVFIDPLGKAWAGAVHRRENGTWASFSTEQKNSVILEARSVINSKLQDFRNTKDIERLQINMATIENEAQPLQNRLLALKQDNMIRPKPNAYFSDICLSRTRAGGVKMVFALDYYKILKDSSAYKKIYDLASQYGPSESKILMDFGRIKYMKLLRRRISQVTTSNSLGNPVEGEVLFDRDIPDTIISAGSDGPRDFRASNTTIGGLREVAISLETGSQGIRFFTAEDRSMIDITDGRYQYGVEMDIEDSSTKYLSSLSRSLSFALRELNQYYEEGTKLGMTRYVVDLSDPHIDSSWERLSVLNSSPGNYEPTSNRFTAKFIKKQRNRWKNDKNNSPWRRSLIEYFKAVGTLTSFSEVYDIETMGRELLKLTAPETGNPRSVSVVMGLIQNMISGIDSLADAKTGRSRGNNTQSQMNKRVTNKTNKVQYWFAEDSFNSDIQKNYGYEYLSEAEGENLDGELITESKQVGLPGLRVVSGGEYDKRLQAETLKYYNTTDPDINMKKGTQDITTGDTIRNSYFGFLSPSFCYLGQEVKTMLDSSGTTKKTHGYDYYSVLESVVLNFNTRLAPTLKQTKNLQKRAIGATAQEYKNNIQSFFANLGLSIEPASTQTIIPSVDKLQLPQPKNSPISQNKNLQGAPPPIFQIKGAPASDLKIEPLSDEIKFEIELKALEQDEINPNSMFLGILKTYIDDGSLNSNGPPGTINKVVSFKKKNTASQEGSDPETIDTYNLNNEINIVNKISQSEETKTDLAKSTGIESGDEKTVNEIIKSLPNQIKALLLSSVNAGPIKDNLFELDFDPVLDVQTSSYFRINYSFLNKIEVAVGYPNKSSMRVKEPTWKPLTPARWLTSGGTSLLCRMSEFSAPALGITHPKGLKLQLFDKYFILQPPIQPEDEETEEIGEIEEPIVVDPTPGGYLATVDDIIETTPDQEKLQTNPVGPKPDPRFCLPFRK